MRLKFIHQLAVRLLIIALSGMLLASLFVLVLPGPVLKQLALLWVARPPDPTPLPPTINAPRGLLPEAAVGLQEWASYESGDERPVGSGFLLKLDDGTVIGVTTAHSVGDIGDERNQLESIVFTVYGQDDYLLESDTLYGPPGVPRSGTDFTVDWVLLKIESEVDSSLVLSPDPRGGPQPGERVLLYSGRGDGVTARGTVQSVDSVTVWVLMDSMDYPGGMSGSPLLSEYTGLVVGMAIAVVPRGDQFMVGFHPIGSLLAKAAAATDFPKIVEYHR